MRALSASSPYAEVAPESMGAGCQTLHVHGRAHEQHLHFSVAPALAA